MKKSFFIVLLYFLASSTILAQERQFTEKEHGGEENGIFGKIDDEINVSPMGQLSYEIPIPTLPGSAGMKPNLSISYNSSIKNGLVGYGFDMTGLSVISRTPSDKFHDNIATAIEFNSRDHFALDGQRLVEYAPSEYRTENNTFAKIVATGISTNPISFKMYTKSGLIYDYVSVSKALGVEESNYVLFWIVTKISDTKGNYLTIKYGGTASENDFYPLEIAYTGNDKNNLSPYASINFEYENNIYSPITYINGLKVKKSKILSSIKLQMEEKIIKTYTFDYQIANYKYQLSKVTEHTADGDHKNPTCFAWSNIENFKIENQNYSKDQLIHKANLTIGDFNGDGLDDFIAIPENENAGWNGWKLFVSHGNSFEQVADGIWRNNDATIEQVVSGDFNGDGYADVVIKKLLSNNVRSCELYTTNVDNNGKISLNFSKTFFSYSSNYAIQVVELNGDGISDLFAWITDSKECKLISSRVGSKGVTPLDNILSRDCPEKWDRVEFGDFNGDGLTDVINLTDDGNYIMYSDGYGTMISALKSSWPDKHHYMELGDFNGDGKTDMLLTGWSKNPNPNGWNTWCINYSKGDGSFSKEYRTKPFEASLKRLFIADFNGDGLDDIQFIDETSSGNNMTQPQVFLNDGSGNFHQQQNGGNVYATDKWHFYSGDFNGDGKSDFLCTSDWNKSNWDGYQLYLMPSEINSLLTEIKDGLGNLTKITYKYLTDKTVFTRGHRNTYPLVSVGLSWPVVSSVSTPNGIGGEDLVTYKYCDALFHKTGRGLLGFASFRVKNENTKTQITTNYEVNTDKYIVAPIYSFTTINNKLIEENSNTYALVSDYGTFFGGNNIFTYLPIAVKQKKYEFNSVKIIKDIKTTYEYDSFGNVTKMVVDDGETESTTINTFTNDTKNYYIGRLTESSVTKVNDNGVVVRTSSFEYDTKTGLLISECFEPNNTLLGYRKSYFHDEYGNIVKSVIMSLDGSQERITQTSYDEKGRFIETSTNALGFSDSYKIEQTTGIVNSVIDKNGIVTNYSYDKLGSLIATTTPIATELRTVGWSSGMEDVPNNALYFIWSKTIGEPYTIEFYDCLGRLLRKVKESLGGKKVFIDQIYNEKGQIAMVSEPYYKGEQQYWNISEYDEAGRTISLTASDGSKSKISYSGQTTITTDPLGHSYYKTYNLNGLLSTTVDHNGTYFLYKYDPDGNCVETKSSQKTILCTYDIAGNRISMEDPDLGLSQDTYNAFGELIIHKDSHGETTYEYDACGRVVSEKRPDTEIFTAYDKGWKGAADEVKSMGSINTCFSYNYDSYGRIIEKHTIIGNKDFEISYTYNATKIESIKYPNGLKIKYDYDACGIQTSVSSMDTKKKYWKLLSLDARGQIEQEQFGNGLLTTTSHEPKRGTISNILTPNIQNWDYRFDAVGNLISRHDLNKKLEETFAYDKLNRLTTVSVNGQVTQSITYNGHGNITSKSDVGKYVYAYGSNKLDSITECNRSVVAWDSITYNSFDKITRIVSNNRTMSLFYGPDKTRIFTDNQVLQKYYVDNLFEQKIDGNEVISINYIFALGKAIAIETQKITDVFSKIVYLHHDHLGSIQAYSDGDGKLIQELSYDAWGLRRDPDTWTAFEIQSVNAVYNDHGFGGHEHIDIFDLINMDGRMYDPIVGRFISADPFIQEPDFTQSFNRYAYCVNNPLSLVDPSGYNWFSKNWKSIFASAVGIAVSVITAGTGSSIGLAIAAGAAGGAVGALTSTLLNGANIGQVAKTTFTGAFWGAIGGATNNLIGEIDNFWLNIGAHTMSEGTMEGVQGGNILHGFLIGGASSMFGKFIDDNLESLGKLGEVASNSILSGTLDEIGGGKFANGAVTGAFAILFNDMMHEKVQLDGERQRLAEIDKPLETIYPEFVVFSGLKLVYNLCKISLVEGFDSFAAFKRVYGNAGEGSNWHHIVEQTPSNIKKFGAKRIHSTTNLIKLPGGKGSIHAKISGYYSSKQPFTHGKTVRQWLSTKSYKEQYDFGMKQLKRLGYK